MNKTNTKRYRVIIVVDVDKLKKTLAMGKLTTEEAIINEFGWLRSNGISLEELQEDV